MVRIAFQISPTPEGCNFVQGSIERIPAFCKAYRRHHRSRFAFPNSSLSASFGFRFPRHFSSGSFRLLGMNLFMNIHSDTLHQKSFKLYSLKPSTQLVERVASTTTRTQPFSTVTSITDLSRLTVLTNWNTRRCATNKNAAVRTDCISLAWMPLYRPEGSADQRWVVVA